MLDENLPAFFLKKSVDGIAHHRSIDLSYHGSDPSPAYNLHHADPNSPAPAHKNCYAAALFDAYNPEVLFAEVLARPGWTQPTLSQEEIRKNGGIPPPPQPVLPAEFTVQLYNPDQQVVVELKEGKWGASDSWHFSLPEEVFRTPSTSVLDHGQSDPASLATTPRINFAWRKESKLSKDLICSMTGKSTDTKKKSSRKDPDIPVALWRQMRELTVYEPNLSRIELEDPKGLEVVLLLSAIVIKDLYFGNKEHMRELFNVVDAAGVVGASGGRKLSSPKTTSASFAAPNALAPGPPVLGPGAPAIPIRSKPSPQQHGQRNDLPRLQTTAAGPSSSKPPPLADPRAQWELDAETARLRAQAEAEAREVERRRRAKEKEDERERRRLQKMVEEEEKAARKKQAAIEQETERLRRLYGVTPISQPSVPVAPSSSRQRQPGPSYLGAPPPPARPALGSNGLYVQSSASASNVLMSGANPNSHLSAFAPSGPGPQKPVKKKSFFGLRSLSHDATDQRRLAKKKSAMW